MLFDSLHIFSKKLMCWFICGFEKRSLQARKVCQHLSDTQLRYGSYLVFYLLSLVWPHRKVDHPVGLGLAD